MTTTHLQASDAFAAPLAQRVRELNWSAVEASLNAYGYAETAPVLSPAECEQVAGLFSAEDRFRSRVDMARHRFGEGEYKYFAHPLPDVVAEIREHAYPSLSRVANRWNEALGITDRYPETHQAFLKRCADAGQRRPTPLLLRYESGGYNCLHQDLYGEVAFPMQVLVFLDRQGIDYTGGEFLLVEQRPRAQSAAEVVPGQQGALVFFTTRTRPVAGTRGYHRVNVRHGVSRVRSGVRRTLGVIFHDAK